MPAECQQGANLGDRLKPELILRVLGQGSFQPFFGWSALSFLVLSWFSFVFEGLSNNLLVGGLLNTPIENHCFKTNVFYISIVPIKTIVLKPYFFIGFLSSAGG